MEELYNETVKDHFFNPRNVGPMENPDGVAQVGDPDCGDTLKLFIRVVDDRITDAAFLVKGCTAAIASASMTTELLKGRTIDEALHLTDSDVLESLGGLPPEKTHCSLMAEQAIVAVISDYKARCADLYSGMDYSYPFLQGQPGFCPQCSCGAAVDE